MRMNTTSEKTLSSQPVERNSQRKKASSNALPMIELKSALDFVERIDSEGLQTLAQQEVSKRLGYAAYTSTPFYRRMLAAKLFGLIDTTQGVVLTRLALDYFKPTDEGAKRQALVTALRNVVGYQKIMERYSGRRLPPVDILRNSIEREFLLIPEGASVCAEVFLRSMQQAGIVASDGTLAPEAPPHTRPVEEPSRKGEQQPSPAALSVNADTESHFLTLDAQRGRRVVVQAPPVITEAELKRIQGWLAVQLHVVPSLASGGGEAPELPSARNS